MIRPAKNFEDEVLHAILCRDPVLKRAGQMPLKPADYIGNGKELFEWCHECFGKIDPAQLEKPGQDFLVVHIPYDSPDLRAIRKHSKKPCGVLIAQLRQLELEEGQDYRLLMAMDKRKSGPPLEYTLIIHQDAYRMIGKAALIKLANPMHGRDLLGYDRDEGYMNSFTQKGSKVCSMIERVVNYSRLLQPDLDQLHAIAIEHNNRPFSQILEGCVELAEMSSAKALMRRAGSDRGPDSGLSI